MLEPFSFRSIHTISDAHPHPLPKIFPSHQNTSRLLHINFKNTRRQVQVDHMIFKLGPSQKVKGEKLTSTSVLQVEPEFKSFRQGVGNCSVGEVLAMQMRVWPQHQHKSCLSAIILMWRAKDQEDPWDLLASQSGCTRELQVQ